MISHPLTPAITLGFIAYAIGIIVYTEHQSSWPTAQATILELDDNQSFPKVSYRYEVNGKFYESKKLNDYGPFGFSPLPDSCPTIERAKEKGETVKVYYSGSNPDRAVINVGMPVLACATVAIGVLVLLFHFTDKIRGLPNS